MTAEEIERLARDDKPLPRYTTLPDACYYETIRALWDAVRSGRVTKEDAHARKMRLLRQYAEYRAGYDNACAVYRKQQDHIRRSELLRAAISKEDDPQEKLRLCLQCIGVMTGDTVLERVELDKIGGATC